MTNEEFIQKLQKIDPETSDSFAHLLADKDNVLHSAGNSDCIRILTERWNALMEIITGNVEPPKPSNTEKAKALHETVMEVGKEIEQSEIILEQPKTTEPNV